MKKHATQEQVMIKLFEANPSLAIDVINEQLANKEHGEALLTIKYLAKSTSDLSSIAKDNELNRTQLYKTFSTDGNPNLDTLSKVLGSLNMCLSVKPIHS